MDTLRKGLVFGGQLSLTVIESTKMVNQAIKIHSLSPVCAAAFGRSMTACTFMSAGLKNEKDKLSVVVNGNGPCGKITVCGNGKLQMRGSIDNANVDIPLKPNGKLDVSGCVGKDGKITVIKSMGLKEPYSGSSKLVDGEIAGDFTAYFAYSEQQPTAMALGVKIGKKKTCVGAGGIIIQALPFAEQENLIKAEKIINKLNNISTIIEEKRLDEVIKENFGEVSFETYFPKYKCLCNRKYIEGILISLGKKELYDIIEKDGKVSVKCEFCNTNYEFNKEDVDKLF